MPGIQGPPHTQASPQGPGESPQGGREQLLWAPEGDGGGAGSLMTHSNLHVPAGELRAEPEGHEAPHERLPLPLLVLGRFHLKVMLEM